MVSNDQIDPAVQKRVQDFNKELTPLLKKYKLVLGALPVLRQNGTIAASPHVFAAEDLQAVEQPTKQETKESGLAKS